MSLLIVDNTCCIRPGKAFEGMVRRKVDLYQVFCCHIGKLFMYDMEDEENAILAA